MSSQGSSLFLWFVKQFHLIWGRVGSTKAGPTGPPKKCPPGRCFHQRTRMQLCTFSFKLRLGRVLWLPSGCSGDACCSGYGPRKKMWLLSGPPNNNDCNEPLELVRRRNSVALFLDSWEQVWQHLWIHVCLIVILGCTVLYDFGFGGNSFH